MGKKKPPKKRLKPTEQEARDLFEEAQRDTHKQINQKRDQRPNPANPEDDEPALRIGPGLKR